MIGGDLCETHKTFIQGTPSPQYKPKYPNQDILREKLNNRKIGSFKIMANKVKPGKVIELKNFETDLLEEKEEVTYMRSRSGIGKICEILDQSPNSKPHCLKTPFNASFHL